MKEIIEIDADALKRRKLWVIKLAKLSGSFDKDSIRIIAELKAELASDGVVAILDHLRLCGAMPEHYGHDSSEEKLYSKYTDAVVSESLSAIGLNSSVIPIRSDSADVQAHGDCYSLVADAKAFRLSRTAKNQKDFKIQALDGWRNGLDYAMLVCPIYQFPNRTSQIYQQAISRDVCILSYAHLAVLVGLAIRKKCSIAIKLLEAILKGVSLLHPSKNAVDYWIGINSILVAFLKHDVDLWTLEKKLSLCALNIAKEESLTYLRLEKNRLLGLTHQQALDELIRFAGVDSRIAQIERIEHGQLLGD